VTKEATSTETTIVLVGLIPQAELLSLPFLLESCWEPEGEGEELGLEDAGKGETEGGGVEGVGLG